MRSSFRSQLARTRRCCRTTPSRSSTAYTNGCSTKADFSAASPSRMSGGCSSRAHRYAGPHRVDRSRRRRSPPTRRRTAKSCATKIRAASRFLSRCPSRSQRPMHPHSPMLHRRNESMTHRPTRTMTPPRGRSVARVAGARPLSKRCEHPTRCSIASSMKAICFKGFVTLIPSDPLSRSSSIDSLLMVRTRESRTSRCTCRRRRSVIRHRREPATC